METPPSLGARGYGDTFTIRYRTNPGSDGGSTRIILYLIHRKSRRQGILRKCRQVIAGFWSFDLRLEGLGTGSSWCLFTRLCIAWNVCGARTRFAHGSI